MSDVEAVRIGDGVRAHVGDWLEVPPIPGGGHHRRRGRIVALLHPDGIPPYRVRWLDDDHETVVFPPREAHLVCGVRAGSGAASGTERSAGA